MAGLGLGLARRAVTAGGRLVHCVSTSSGLPGMCSFCEVWKAEWP